jgi:hypothetical protein
MSASLLPSSAYFASALARSVTISPVSRKTPFASLAEMPRNLSAWLATCPSSLPALQALHHAADLVGEAVEVAAAELRDGRELRQALDARAGVGREVDERRVRLEDVEVELAHGAGAHHHADRGERVGDGVDRAAEILDRAAHLADDRRGLVDRRQLEARFAFVDRHGQALFQMR